MKGIIYGKKQIKLSSFAILSFFISLTLCFSVIIMTIINRENIEKLQMEHLILEKTNRINEVISRLLYKTNSLSMMVILEDGNLDNFDRFAPSIVDDPSILNILVAPDGIVSNVYPIEGNSAVLGLNFFAENAGNREAITAINTGRLVLGGPFLSAQGIEVLVGRLPVFIDTPDEKQRFWGLVSVTLRFPHALDGAELSILNTKGFAYELWRINPDTGEKQVIVSDYEYAGSNPRFIEKHIPIINADWYLRVWPVRMWYSYPENLLIIIAGFFISLLVFFVVQNNTELKQMGFVLESMAKCDSLTGIYNRRHFMESTKIDIDRIRRTNEDCFVILFDLDRFKSINDIHGHYIGDNVLIETTSRIKTIIRPYDIFARYGGEEFIIYLSGINKRSIIDMAERLRLSLCDKKFEYEGVSLDSSASFGIAQIIEYDINKAIMHADKALYKAKNEGRNKVVFWD
ncbi:MAG: sensor domain-containing diguanylate cyclase [Treponema sp.]|nr:sensor domain-containing diguanylate cyclase [Treponema sp.]